MKTAVVIFILIAIGKLTALGKDMSMSAIFGISWQADAYFIASGVPLLIFSAVYATIPIVFLPLYTKIKLQQNQSTAFGFSNNFLSIFLLLSLLLCVMSIYFAPNIIDLISQKLPNEVRLLSINLARIFSLSFVLTIFIGVFSSIQYANKSLIGPQLIPIINNIIVMSAIIFLSRSYGIEVVAYSAVFAWLVQIPLQKKLTTSEYIFKFNFSIKGVNINHFFILFIPAFFGILIDQVNILVDLYLSSGLKIGTVSAISYSSKLTMLVGLTLPIVVTTIMYPYYSDSAVKGMTRTLSLLVEKSIKISLMLTVPILIISILFNDDIIKLLFQRGEFNDKATIYTSEIFLYYAFAIVFIGIREVFSKVFFALQKPNIILYISTISVAINIILSITLVQHIGVVGIPLATSISVLVHIILQCVMLSKILGSRFYRKLDKFLIKISIASAGLIFAFFLFDWLVFSTL